MGMFRRASRDVPSGPTLYDSTYWDGAPPVNGRQRQRGGIRQLWSRAVRGFNEQRSITELPWDQGGPRSGFSSVSVEQALSLVPVFSAVALLARTISTTPLQGYRRVSNDERHRMELLPQLFRDPEPGVVIGRTSNLVTWLHRAVTSIALRGNAYGLITSRDGFGYPTAIEWLHPDHVQVQDGMLSGRGSFRDPIWYWNGREVSAEDILHIPWFVVPGQVKGLSPIAACAVTIGTGISAQVYASDWFDAGGIPSGKFKNTKRVIDVSGGEAEAVTARLTQRIRQRKPLVYGADWDYEPIAINPHEARFIETMKMNATQVAAMFGVPPEKIGGEAGGSLTYNTTEQNSLDFNTWGLQPWFALFESHFFNLIPQPQYVKFNADARVRSSLTDRYGAYQIARNIGLESIDEQRAKEDRSPIPGGKGKSYAPLGVMEQEAKPAPPPPAPAVPGAPPGAPPPPKPPASPRFVFMDGLMVPAGEPNGNGHHG